jgi:hypothetical protein
MPRWVRVIRGMIGIGFTFAVGVGGVVGLVGAIAVLGSRATPVEVLQTAGKFALVSFLLGMVFSGVLALVARRRRFNHLSIPLVASLGGAAGLVYFLFLAMNGGRNWTPRLAVLNFALLLTMGTVAAVATLLMARRANSALAPVDEVQSLGASEDEIVISRKPSKVEVPRRPG